MDGRLGHTVLRCCSMFFAIIIPLGCVVCVVCIEGRVCVVCIGDIGGRVCVVCIGGRVCVVCIVCIVCIVCLPTIEWAVYTSVIALPLHMLIHIGLELTLGRIR